MILWLILIPLPFAALCLALQSSIARRLSLVAGAAAHLLMVAATWRSLQPMGLMLGVDALGQLFIALISILFLATSIYFVGYHQKAVVSQRIFLACMLALLSALTLVCASQHLGLMWVAMESASLAVTPLIYFRLGPRSLEATWKFLLMNSVGIALALMGIFCVALATTGIGDGVGLTVADLMRQAAKMDVTWLRLGFLLTLVGFGTKMGVAPLHSWKPDAYGEAPPPVAALLAGGMTLAAFVCILRIYQVVASAGLASFAGNWMIAFGLLSIATAAIFIIGNNDYRRLLAYTSVEHMGILMLGVGLSVGGQEASMLHALHNTLNKGVLFFVAGFLWRIYRTNRISDIRGSLHQHPAAGVLLLAGICATTGLPPFGMFYSEFGMFRAAAGTMPWWVTAIFAVTLAMVFVGVMTAMLPMAFGEPSKQEEKPEQTPGWAWRKPVMLIPAGGLVLLALSLGVYQPRVVSTALRDAAACLNPDAKLASNAHPTVAAQEVRP